MPDLTVYTNSLGHQPADTTFTVTNIRFTDGAGGNGLRDGDSSGLQTINGDPITLVADATDPDRSSAASRADPSSPPCQHHHLSRPSSTPMTPIRNDPVNLGDFIWIEAVDTSGFATAGAMP